MTESEPNHEPPYRTAESERYATLPESHAMEDPDDLVDRKSTQSPRQRFKVPLPPYSQADKTVRSLRDKWRELPIFLCAVRYVGTPGRLDHSRRDFFSDLPTRE